MNWQRDWRAIVLWAIVLCLWAFIAGYSIGAEQAADIDAEVREQARVGREHSRRIEAWAGRPLPALYGQEGRDE